MESTRTSSGRGKTTRVPGHPPTQPPATAAGRGSRTSSTSSTTTTPPVQVSTSSTSSPSRAPARQSLRDAAPPMATPVTERPVRVGHTVAALPAAPMPMEDDDKATLSRAPLSRDAARALLKGAVPLHLRSEEVPEACKTVYDLCIREKLNPEGIQLLTRTMLEEHAPTALQGANAALNLMGHIVPLQPAHREWVASSYQPVLVQMMVGVAQATARPGEPALSDAFVAQAALALVMAVKSDRKDGKTSHPDGRYFRDNLIRQFSYDVLSQLPPGSTAAFLNPLRRRDWLMKEAMDGSPWMLYHMLLKVTDSMGKPCATVHHEHLDRVADYVMSLGLSLVDAGLQLAPCMSACAPWIKDATARDRYRQGILERMSGRPTLPPKQAGEIVLATLLRDAVMATPAGEDLAWTFPAFGSLERFESLANIQRARLLVPGLSSAQQARLLRLALVASDRQRGAEEFHASMHQLVVDLTLRGTDLEAVALMACAFVRGGGAPDTKSLERAVDLGADAGGKTTGRKAEATAERKAETKAGPKGQAPVGTSSHWIDDLRRALEPARRVDADVEMEASSSTTTTSPPTTETSSSRAVADEVPEHSSLELVQALQRGGSLAKNPLNALVKEDLDWPHRLALFEGALAIVGPLSVADAGAMQTHLGKLSCTDTVKAQALQALLRHAEPAFAADGQKALWSLLDQGAKGKAAGKRTAGQQLLYAKDTPLDTLKVAYQVMVEDSNRAWDAVVKAREHTQAHHHRPLVERLDATIARLTAAADAAKKSPDPRAQQLVEEAQGRIKTLSQARREFAGSDHGPTSSSSSSSS